MNSQRSTDAENSLLHGQTSNANFTKADAENYIKQILKEDLPRSEGQSVENNFRWNFVLDKHLVWDKKAKPPRKRKQFLTRAQRKQLNLLSLPKDGWNYDDLQKMRQLWKEYMRRNIDLIKKAPSCEEAAWANFSFLLAKSEFVGAEITVARSTVPSTVGITGTVVLETRSTLQVVTPCSELKTVLKKPSVFTVKLDNTLFTIFGKHMAIKPGERSVKKIKSQMIADL